MEITALVSLDEYLSTCYDPDCDYVDGVLLERNVGERDHSRLQTDLATWLNNLRKQFGIRVYVEQRIQVSRTRFRIPDICVVVGPEPDEQIFTTPPFLCVEILSPEDRARRLQERIEDYLAFGVRYVWVIDPKTRLAEIHTASGSEKVRDGLLKTRNPDIVVPLSELFANE